MCACCAKDALKKGFPILVSVLLQVMYVCMLCYNFGLDVFHKGKYAHSVTWLK